MMSAASKKSRPAGALQATNPGCALLGHAAPRPGPPTPLQAPAQPSFAVRDWSVATIRCSRERCAPCSDGPAAGSRGPGEQLVPLSLAQSPMCAAQRPGRRCRRRARPCSALGEAADRPGGGRVGQCSSLWWRSAAASGGRPGPQHGPAASRALCRVLCAPTRRSVAGEWSGVPSSSRPRQRVLGAAAAHRPLADDASRPLFCAAGHGGQDGEQPDPEHPQVPEEVAGQGCHLVQPARPQGAPPRW